MADFTDLGQTLLDAELWDEAEAALKQRLEVDPRSAGLMEILARLYRQKGDLAASAGLYGRLSELVPDHPTAAHLNAVLSGSDLPADAPGAGPWPAPIVRIPSFLPQRQRDRLFEIACEHRDELAPMLKYVPSSEGPVVGVHDVDFRHQVGLRGVKEVKEILRPRWLALVSELLPRLQLEPFTPTRTGSQLVVSGDGHFGKPHRDDLNGLYKVSVVYHLHRHPKAFTGGDLLVYDTDVHALTYNPARFTRIVHTDNTLVVYPSVYFHQITRVDCPSGDFRDSRMAAPGHIG